MANQNQMFIVRGVTQEGNEVFYTGKAGDKFTSPLRTASFGYVSQLQARHRAKCLNSMTAVHGVWFIAVAFDQNASAEAA